MKAKKALGQHFLNQESIAERTANSIPLENCSCLVEVGPGKGILTNYLLEKGLPVYAVELDRDMIPILEQAFSSRGLHIIHGDILRTNIPAIVGENTNFGFIGNFPYNISSQIVFQCLAWKNQIPALTGMFQKEMAARICSPHGSKVYGVTSVLTQAYYHASMLFIVKPGSFSPPPNVDSAVINLVRYRTEIDGVPESVLRQVVKMAFHQRRKKIRNSLAGVCPEDILIEEQVVDLRPEQIPVEQFIQLSRRVAEWKAQQKS